MKPVVIIISDSEWTLKAMHLACALARNTQSPLVILDFRLIKNVGLLGTGIAYETPTMAEYITLRDYFMIAEDYGVIASVQPVEYESYADVLVQMVELFTPTTVFAKAPKSLIPAVSRLILWQIRRQLAQFNCQLYTLDETYTNKETLAPQMGLPVPK